MQKKPRYSLNKLAELIHWFQGLRVPEPLRKYLPGAPDFIPFSKDLPKDSTSQKAKGAKAEKTVKEKVVAAGEKLKDMAV